jgi:hypothetical protein
MRFQLGGAGKFVKIFEIGAANFIYFQKFPPLGRKFVKIYEPQVPTVLGAGVSPREIFRRYGNFGKFLKLAQTISYIFRNFRPGPFGLLGRRTSTEGNL